MADVTMNSPTIPNITPALNDLLLAWDANAGANGEFPISELQTLFEAVFARVGATNTFTFSQIIAGNLSLQVYDAGAGGVGRSVVLDRSNNASEPAPGAATFRSSVGGAYSIYVDDGGLLRIRSGGGPTNGQITAGTVVGTQTAPSSLDKKDVLAQRSPIEHVLASVIEGAEGVRAFRYKPVAVEDEAGRVSTGERPYGGEIFEGVIIDYAPRYGMDRDETHPDGKSLNSIMAIGDLLRAVAWLVEQNAALAERVAALEAA